MINRVWRVVLATTTTLGFSAGAASAMPAVGAAIVAGIQGITATTILTTIGGAVLSFGANYLIQKLFGPDEPEPRGIKQRIESGGDLPLSFIMGEYATAGKLVYVNEHDTPGSIDNEWLVFVIALSEMPINGMSSTCFVNGEKCTINWGDAVDGWAPVDEYIDDGKNFCEVKFYDGTQTVANDWLVNRFEDDPDKPWTEDMVGHGVAYVIARCLYSKTGVWSGIPQFKWVLEGIPLYDPRKDSTVPGGSGAQRWTDKSTWKYSANPKVMAYNVIRGFQYSGNWIWGGQMKQGTVAEQYRMPLSYWFAAMNVCDEEIERAEGPDIPRYIAGLEVSVDQQPIAVLKELDKACAGYTTEYGGTWKTWSGISSTSVMTITDDDIIITAEQTDDLFKPLQETYNGARATYVSKTEGWVMKDASPRIFDDFVAEDDDQELIADISLPTVTQWNQVQRLMRAAVLDARRQRNHVFQLAPSAFLLEPMDVITWNSDRNGYVSKKFLVTSIDDLPNCNQLVAIREIDPDDYDWDTEYELPESVGTLTSVKPTALALDFTVSADQIDRDGGGKDKPAILIEWDWNSLDGDLDYIRYEVRKKDQTKVFKEGTFRNIEEGARTITHSVLKFGKEYQVRLFVQPQRRNRQGQWTGWKNVTLVNIDITNAPALTETTETADDGTERLWLDIECDDVGADVTYVFSVTIDGAETKYASEENVIQIPVIRTKDYTVKARAIGDNGRGDWSPDATITIGPPTAPTGVVVTGKSGRVVMIWDSCPDADYKRTRVYKSATNDFSTAFIDGHASGNKYVDEQSLAATRYYWFRNIDMYGGESDRYPSGTIGLVGTST